MKVQCVTNARNTWRGTCRNRAIDTTATRDRREDEAVVMMMITTAIMMMQMRAHRENNAQCSDGR